MIEKCRDRETDTPACFTDLHVHTTISSYSKISGPLRPEDFQSQRFDHAIMLVVGCEEHCTQVHCGCACLAPAPCKSRRTIRKAHSPCNASRADVLPRICQMMTSVSISYQSVLFLNGVHNCPHFSLRGSRSIIPKRGLSDSTGEEGSVRRSVFFLNDGNCEGFSRRKSLGPVER